MLDGVSTQKMCRDVVVSTPRNLRWPTAMNPWSSFTSRAAVNEPACLVAVSIPVSNRRRED